MSVRPTSYEKVVRRLYRTNLFNPVKLGLDNIDTLLTALDSPFLPTSPIPAANAPPHPPIIHIAGTNGKGSVAYKIAQSLTNSGFKTGLFVSPHVSSFRERAQIDFEAIPESEVIRLLPLIFSKCKDIDLPCTFFELTTALALEYFAASKVDMIVLETGLGGRLDSTNVVDSTLSVITTIGLEHTRILGDTVELIAREKGGIMKAERPALIGPFCPIETLRAQAKEKGAIFHTPDAELYASLDYDAQNSLLARNALSLLVKTPQYQSVALHTGISINEEAIDAGIARRPPCRFEHTVVKGVDGRRDVDVILDVAHNPPAMLELFKKLDKAYPSRQVKIVVGMSSDKDIKLAADTILERCDVENIYLCEAQHPRAASIEQIVSASPALGLAHLSGGGGSGVFDQCSTCVKAAEEDGALVVVCGSVFIMAEARRALGYEEPRDSDYVAEMAGAGIMKVRFIHIPTRTRAHAHTRTLARTHTRTHAHTETPTHICSQRGQRCSHRAPSHVFTNELLLTPTTAPPTLRCGVKPRCLHRKSKTLPRHTLTRTKEHAGALRQQGAERYRRRLGSRTGGSCGQYGRCRVQRKVEVNIW